MKKLRRSSARDKTALIAAKAKARRAWPGRTLSLVEGDSVSVVVIAERRTHRGAPIVLAERLAQGDSELAAWEYAALIGPGTVMTDEEFEIAMSESDTQEK